MEANKYIGKKYVSSDNSYTEPIDGGPEVYLAGTLMTEQPKETEIVSIPYKRGNLPHLYFINVKYNGFTYSVIFYKENINADLQKRIQQNKEEQEEEH